MKKLVASKLLLFFALMFVAEEFSAQEPSCIEISRMAAMAQAKTVAALKETRKRSGNGYRAQLIFAARMLQLAPNDKAAAESLLRLLPKDDSGPEMAVWLDLSQLQTCPSGGAAAANHVPLDLLRQELPRLTARAILLVPDMMQSYVNLALFSCYPDSDYAVQMREVCTEQHEKLVDAVSRLDSRDRLWFVSRFFNPDGCRTICFPEQ
jgi:hypothetical protein